MRGVMERQTYRCDLGLWRESASRLGRGRGCGQDVRRPDLHAPKHSENGLALVVL